MDDVNVIYKIIIIILLVLFVVLGYLICKIQIDIDNIKLGKRK